MPPWDKQQHSTRVDVVDVIIAVARHMHKLEEEGVCVPL